METQVSSLQVICYTRTKMVLVVLLSCLWRWIEISSISATPLRSLGSHYSGTICFLYQTFVSKESSGFGERKCRIGVEYLVELLLFDASQSLLIPDLKQHKVKYSSF